MNLKKTAGKIVTAVRSPGHRFGWASAARVSRQQPCRSTSTHEPSLRAHHIRGKRRESFSNCRDKNARTEGPCGQPYFYSLETEGASFTSETTQCKLFAPDVGLELGELVHLTVILLHLSPMAFASYAVMPRKVIFSGRRAASRTGC